jgi:AcrR family transcriptional regulator
MPSRLAQSAFELFADNGFDNVNLDQIAGRVGVTKGSLYWHYKNKKELILAACQHYYRQWQEDVQAAIAPAADPSGRLQSALTFSVDSCIVDQRNRLFTTGIFMLMQEDADVRASWMQFYSCVREFYVGLVTAAQRSEAVSGRDARRDVDLMLEAMEGLKLRAGFEPHIAKPAERQAIVEGLLGIFWLGLPNAVAKRMGGQGPGRLALGRNASPRRSAECSENRPCRSRGGAAMKGYV